MEIGRRPKKTGDCVLPSGGSHVCLTYKWINFIQLYLIDGYCHLLFSCYNLITQYYHNITQLDAKCLHLIRYSTLQNRGPLPSFNHNKTLADMPTYNLLNVLSVGSFFL